MQGDVGVDRRYVGESDSQIMRVSCQVCGEPLPCISRWG